MSGGEKIEKLPLFDNGLFAFFCGTKGIKESIVRKGNVCREEETLKSFKVPINIFQKCFRLFLFAFHSSVLSGSSYDTSRKGRNTAK